MPEALLTKTVILDALEALTRRLVAAGIHSSIYVVGGAAMSVAQGLPENWLNDNAKGFLPIVLDDPAPVERMVEDIVSVTAASAELLLVMKIRASRGRRDREDLVFLLAQTGIATLEDAIGLYERYYPEDPLTERAVPMLEAIFAKKRMTDTTQM